MNFPPETKYAQHRLTTKTSGKCRIMNAMFFKKITLINNFFKDFRFVEGISFVLVWKNVCIQVAIARSRPRPASFAAADSAPEVVGVDAATEDLEPCL